MADQALGEGHDAIGDAAIEHQLAGEDEERDGEEREDVHARRHALEHDGERQALVEDGGDGGEADREGDGYAQHQAEREDDAEDGQCHDGITSSPRHSATMCSRENRAIRMPAITSGRWLMPSGRPSVGIL